MSQNVSSRYPSHTIVFDYLVSQRTGILTFEPGNRKLYIDSGQLIFANSEIPGEHFASILVESGTFSQAQLDEAKAAASGSSLGRQIKSMGLATSQQLAHALKQQITYIVDRALALEGNACIAQETQLPQRLPKLKIQTLGLFIKSIFKLETESLEVPIQFDQSLFKTTLGDLFLSKIAIPPSYLELFNFLKEHETFSPGTLQEIAKLDGDQLKKMIYILHQLGILTFKDDTLLYAEPLEDLTSDGDTFQEDTMDEDALAVVLPATVPPKTDLQGQNDPSRKVRQINLPTFTQVSRPDHSPTLRVQDPRKSDLPELEETVRQFQNTPVNPMSFEEEDKVSFLDEDEPDSFDNSQGLPNLEQAISLEHDLSTISTELDPKALQEIPEFSNELPVETDASPSFTEVPDSEDDSLDKSYDTSPDNPAEGLPMVNLDDSFSSNDDSKSWESPPELPTSPFSELPDASEDQPSFGTATVAHSVEDILNQASFTQEDQTSQVEPEHNLSQYDTEPSLPIADIKDSFEATSTKPFPAQFSESNLDTPKAEKNRGIIANVIMPEPEKEPVFAERKPKTKKKRTLIKPLLALLILSAAAFASYKFYFAKTSSSVSEAPLVADATPEPTTKESLPKEEPPASEETSQSLPLDEPEESAKTTEASNHDPALTPEEETAVSDPELTNETSTLQEDIIPEEAPISSDVEEEPLPKPIPPPTTAKYEAGNFEQYLQQSVDQFKASGSRYSLVLLVACQKETVEETLARWPNESLLLLPRNVKGNSCWMLTWGSFDTYGQAAKARNEIPENLKSYKDGMWIVKPNS